MLSWKLRELKKKSLPQSTICGISRIYRIYIINKKPDIETVLPTQIIEEIKGKAIGVVGDVGELKKLAKQAIKDNPKAVEDYKKGKEAALQVLIGAIMRLSAGKAEVGKVKQILAKLLLEKDGDQYA